MLTERKHSFSSSANSRNFHTPNDSMASSISSDSSFSSYMGTPQDSPTTSSFDVKVEDLQFQQFTPLATPERYGNGNHGFLMSTMAHEMLSSFQDPNAFFPLEGGKELAEQDLNLHSFNSYAVPMFPNFNSQHGFTNDVPSLDMDAFSPTSAGLHSSPPVPMNFVDPTQTSFIEPYMQSPMRQVKLQLDNADSDFENERLFHNSPVSIGYFEPTAYSDVKSDSSTPSRQSGLRHSVYEPPQSSAALHRIQGHNPKNHTSTRKIKKENLQKMFPVRVQKEASEKCLVPGCHKAFQRREHLRRHERTHKTGEMFLCKFCSRPFQSNRSDNIKAHIKLHTKEPKKGARTDYHADAMAEWESMGHKSKKGDADIKPPKTRAAGTEMSIRTRARL